MTSELVVDVQPKEITLAVLEDKKLVELQQESQSESYAVGNIYLGRVKKLMPALNAAFVDVGHKKDAFLHYLDLGVEFNSVSSFQEAVEEKKKPQIQKMKLLPEIEKEGLISEKLKVGQEVLVQVAKEPISTKGPRLTAEISFAGRFMVLIPFVFTRLTIKWICFCFVEEWISNTIWLSSVTPIFFKAFNAISVSCSLVSLSPMDFSGEIYPVNAQFLTFLFRSATAFISLNCNSGSRLNRLF